MFKDIREGEERLMLSVLENAVEYFQKYVLARNPSGKKLFREVEEYIPITYDRGSCVGRKRSSRRILVRVIVQVARS